MMLFALLDREVRVVLEGVDKFGNLFGSVLYPEGDQAVDLGLQLVQGGFAKVTFGAASFTCMLLGPCMSG